MTVLMDNADLGNYIDTLVGLRQTQDDGSPAPIAKDTFISWAAQYLRMQPDNNGEDVYLFSILTVDSNDAISKSYGIEPKSRQWVIIDDQWDTEIFGNMGDIYKYLAKRYKELITNGHLMFRYYRYRPEKIQHKTSFILTEKNVTLDLINYVDRTSN